MKTYCCQKSTADCKIKKANGMFYHSKVKRKGRMIKLIFTFSPFPVIDSLKTNLIVKF